MGGQSYTVGWSLFAFAGIMALMGVGFGISGVLVDSTFFFWTKNVFRFTIQASFWSAVAGLGCIVLPIMRGSASNRSKSPPKS